MRLEDIGNKKYLGKGKQGTCYILENNNVFKKFKYPIDLIDINRFKYFLNYQNDSFMFPFDFVYDDEKFYGYISKKAPGIVLEKNFSSNNILDMSKHLISLENNIKYISKGKIMMYDFHEENILYDKNKFYVIDVDDYNNVSIYSEKEIENRNIEFTKKMFLSLFKNNLEINKISPLIIEKIYKYVYLDLKSSEMLYEIKNDLDKFYKENINSLDDIKKIR